MASFARHLRLRENVAEANFLSYDDNTVYDYPTIVGGDPVDIDPPHIISGGLPLGIHTIRLIH